MFLRRLLAGRSRSLLIQHRDRGVTREGIKPGGWASVVSSPCSLLPEIPYYIGGCSTGFYPRCLHKALTLIHASLAQERRAFWVSLKSCFSVLGHVNSITINSTQIFFFFFLFLREDFYCCLMIGIKNVHIKMRSN